MGRKFLAGESSLVQQTDKWESQKAEVRKMQTMGMAERSGSSSVAWAP